MNIDDVTEVKPSEENVHWVIELFQHQEALIRKYDPIEKANGFPVPSEPYKIDSHTVQFRVKNFFWRTTEELCEAMGSQPTSFMNWKKFWEQEATIRHFFEELADALHFFIEASIYASMNPELYAGLADEILADATGKPDKEITSLFGTRSVLIELIFEVILKMGYAANTFKNKPWKQSQMPTDVVEMGKWIVQAWTALIVLFKRLGCNASDIRELYMKKNQVNHWRIGSNY